MAPDNGLGEWIYYMNCDQFEIISPPPNSSATYLPVECFVGVADIPTLKEELSTNVQPEPMCSQQLKLIL